MKLLITADIHCSDDSKDSYRFLLFDWLAKQQEIHKTNAVLILGDLVTAKDYHSSVLLNKIVDGLKKLKPPVFIDRGNHDGINPTLPYFKFLNHIDGLTFCVEPTFIKEYNILMVPHQISQTALDTAFAMAPEGCLIMAHNTFIGAVSETGSPLSGLAVPPNKARALYAGDVHKPQKYGKVTSVGAPYHVRHGDQYQPRVLLLDNDKEIDLYFPAPKKLSLRIRDVSEIPPLEKGDQVKVVFELPRSEMVEWQRHKQSVLDYCKAKGIENYGIELEVPQPRKRQRLDDSQPSRGKSNLEYFKAFCAAEKVPMQMKEAGLRLLGDLNE